MKKIFFFDTETTGFKKGVDRIVQFGAVFGSYDETSKIFYEERVINQIINPQREIPQKSFEIHGITYELAQKFGTMESYIKEFMAYISKADIIVCHNARYDRDTMLAGELQILSLSYNLSPKIMCTMKGWADYHGCTYPKLGLLYNTLFGEDFANAHDALEDIQATKRIFFEMLNRGIVTLD